MAIATGSHIIITDIGNLKRASAISNGINVPFKYFAVGDYGDYGLSYPPLDSGLNRLHNELWRGDIISLENLEGEDQGKIVVSTYIGPYELGNVYLKEFGIFTPENELIIIGHLDNFYKPPIESQSAQSVVIQVTVNWGYSHGVQLVEGDNHTFATVAMIKESTNESLSGLNKPLMYFMAQM